jgi:hypothetical protein
MEYRGKHYIVAKDTESGSWTWTVDLSSHTVKSGEAKTRAMAITAVILCINGALGKLTP